MAQKLSKLDWGVVGAGAIALIALFLPWYGASYSSSFGSASVSVSGFSTSYGWLGGLLIIAAGVVLFLQRMEVGLPKVSVGPAVIVLGASGLGTLIVIIRWLTLPRGGGGAFGASYSYGPRIGIIIALIVGIVQAVCGFLLFRASGEALPWKAAGASAPGYGAPMPPGSGAMPPSPGTMPPWPDTTPSGPGWTPPQPGTMPGPGPMTPPGDADPNPGSTDPEAAPPA